ncbi:MAG: sulfurtransferase [Deltaproteobacteria bacterium]|nr:MAG: sulfurtransferase [Deltaproteobacteria bacterium]
MSEKATSEWLASTDWIAENLNNPDVRLIEIGALKDPDAYYASHIPGTLLWPWKETLWHPEMRDFATPEGFSNLMSKSGISHDTTIVFYSDQIQFNNYAFWVCAMRGHKNMKIMNGDMNLWLYEDLPITTDVPNFTPTDYPVRPLEEDCRIGRDGVLAGLSNPDRVLLDMRTKEEYVGKRVSPDWFPVDHGAVRKGHIPGARNLYYMNLLNEDNTYKTQGELQEAYSTVGATPDKELVSYCRLSHRGSMAWFVAKFLLGYPRAKVYDGSWTEWGSLVGVPIVNMSLEKEL